MSTPIVTKILHTRMRVSHLDETVRFYTQVLGLQEVRRMPSPRGAQLVFLRAPEGEEEIEITWIPDAEPVKVQPDLMHIAFRVKDMDAFAAHIRKLGIEFSDGPTQLASGRIIAFIDAPEGYEVELIQSPGM
ncbi:MAG: VOC family protein [Candidatus Methanomethylophilaceae archaeon]|jgi:lactoylglutathione lyase|nr:VOC family protein [Candidatus Methanomethylophilaceae archaeon]